jgi:hypothetical protein
LRVLAEAIEEHHVWLHAWVLMDNHFLWELVKFWGSLARIGLSWVGNEDWPPHFGYGKFD